MKNIIFICLLFAAASAQVAQAKPKNISFVSHRTSSQKVDVGEPGLSVGDIFTNQGDLLDAKTIAVIGTFAGRHVVIAADIPGGTEKRDMIIQNTLPGGTVISVTIADFNTATNFPVSRQDRVIVGGTGKYNGAKGIRYTDPIEGKPGDALVHLKFK
jgi:hypothetical protein